jgi:ParB family transcriptional regulator, chromosome partitioning protein
MSEEQKAERKTLIANNKAWDSSTVVRREWMSESPDPHQSAEGC